MWVWFPEGRNGIITGLRRGTVVETDDSGTQQILKRMRGLASEAPEDVYRPQAHGFSSHAPSGSEGLFAALGGRSDRLVALGYEHKDKRPRNLPEGGVAIYDADGKVLKIVKDGTDWNNGKRPFKSHDATTHVILASDYVAIGVDGGRYVVARQDRIDIAVKSPDERAVPQVVTTAGPSGFAFCRVD